MPLLSDADVGLAPTNLLSDADVGLAPAPAQGEPTFGQAIGAAKDYVLAPGLSFVDRAKRVGDILSVATGNAQVQGGLAALQEKMPVGENPLTRAGSALGSTALGFAQGMASPMGQLATGALFTPAAPLAAGYFGVEMGKGTYQGGKDFYTLFKKILDEGRVPTPEETQALTTLLTGTAAMGMGAGHIGARGVAKGREMLRGKEEVPPVLPPEQPQAVAPPQVQVQQPQIAPQVQVVQQPVPVPVPVAAPPPAPAPAVPTIQDMLQQKGPITWEQSNRAHGVEPTDIGTEQARQPLGTVQVQPPPSVTAPPQPLTLRQKVEQAQAERRRALEEARKQAQAQQPVLPPQLPQPEQQKKGVLPNDKEMQFGVLGGQPQGEAPVPQRPVEVPGATSPAPGGVLQAPSKGALGQVDVAAGRGDVETTFRHDLKNLATVISGAKTPMANGKAVFTEQEAVRFTKRANAIFDDVVSGKKSLEWGRRALAIVKEDVEEAIHINKTEEAGGMMELPEKSSRSLGDLRKELDAIQEEMDNLPEGSDLLPAYEKRWGQLIVEIDDREGMMSPEAEAAMRKAKPGFMDFIKKRFPQDTGEKSIMELGADRAKEIKRTIDESGWKPPQLMADNKTVNYDSMREQSTERSLKIVEESIYEGRNLSIIARELVQNMRDAYQEYNGPRKMHEIVDANGYYYGAADEGKGMDSEIFLTKYLPPFTSGKKVGEGGGFGLAKAIVLGRPEEYTMLTVARDSRDGKMYQITMRGSGPGWKEYAMDFFKGKLPEEAKSLDFTHIKFNDNLEVWRKLAPYKAKPGTYFLLRDPTLDFNVKTEGAFNVLHPSFETRSLRQEYSSRLTGAMHDLMKNPSRQAFDAVYENAMWKSEVTTHTKPYTKTFDTQQEPNFDVELIYDPKAPVGEISGITAHVLSNGSYQFTTSISVGGWGDKAILPKEMVIDVRPKVQADAKGYPFTASRDAFKTDVQSTVRKAFRKAVQDAKDKIKGEFKKAADQPLVSQTGIRYINFFKEVDKAFVDRTEKEAPVVADMSDWIKELFPVFNEALKENLTEQEKIDKGMPNTYGENKPDLWQGYSATTVDVAKAEPGGLTTRKDVLGANIYDPTTQNYKTYLNPYIIAKKVLALNEHANVPLEEGLARVTLDALTHEITHNAVRDEDAGLSRALTFLQTHRAEAVSRAYTEMVKGLYGKDYNLKEQLQNLTKLGEELKNYDITTEVAVFNAGKERSDWTKSQSLAAVSRENGPEGGRVGPGDEGVRGGEEVPRGERGNADLMAVRANAPSQGYNVTQTGQGGAGGGGTGGPTQQAAPAPGPLNQPTAQVGPSILKKTVKEGFKAEYNKWRGYSAPTHTAANPEVADKLVRYASSRIAAPEVSKWMATDVLGAKYKDPVFDKLVGSTLVEDRLRAIKQSFIDLADEATKNGDPVKAAEFMDKANSVTTLVGQPYSPFKTEKAFQDALKNPDVAAAIERHKETVQPMAQEAHEALGGKLARSGEETEAFVNLRAILAPEDVETANSMIFGSRKGNLANPRLRGSVFSKEAQGTGWQYVLPYRSIAERMIRGNYEQYALKQYYDSLVKNKLAFEAKPGDTLPPVEGMKKIEIKPGRAFIGGKNLWVRADLEPEMRRALDVDQVDKIGMGLALDLLTDVQVIGPTDLAWHTVNMYAVLAGSLGGKTALYDAMRKMTPVGWVDGAVRMGKGVLDSFMDTPEAQKIVAEYSRVGAGRAKPIHRGGILSKAATAVTGIPLEKTEKYDPFHYLNMASSKVLKVLDTGGRIAASRMFDNLVERKWVENTEQNRREFINRMGQYNSRLMPQWQSIMRENSLSSFVVAGKNMNRQAIRRIIASPGFRAANPQAFVKSRLIEALSLASMMWALPVMTNLAITGKPFGREGVPPGGIDLGTNDEKGRPKYFDPLQLLLIRRGRRILGLEAISRGTDEKLGVAKTWKEVIKDIFAGYIHPWAGPSIRTLSVATSGRDFPSGYLQSRNPTDYAENLWAAMKNANPSVASYFKDVEETGKGDAASPFKQLGGAFGFKTGRNLTQIQKLDKKAQDLKLGDSFESLPFSDRRKVEKEVDKEKQPKPLLADRSGAERNLWDAFARQDAVEAKLPKEQRDWLKKNGLQIAGYETELTAGGVQVPGTRKDAELMQKVVVQEYQKVIGQLMRKVGQPKQEQLNKAMTYAKGRARVALRKSMPKKAATAVPATQ